jgi:hypothetical protein
MKIGLMAALLLSALRVAGEQVDERLVGTWLLTPRFTIEQARCDIAGDPEETWKLQEDGTFVVSDGFVEVSLQWRTDSGRTAITIRTEEREIEIFYFVIDEDTVLAIVNIEDAERFNIGILKRLPR